MAEVSARLRTVDEHDRLIECLIRRDYEVCLQAMEVHRASTASGLAPEAQLRLTHPTAALTVGPVTN